MLLVALLFAVGPAASMLEGLWGFAFLVFILVPAALAPVVAARIAHVRSSRFTHALYTMPVSQAQVLGAHVLANLVLCAAYLLAVSPYVLIATIHLDGSSLSRFLAAGALTGLLAVSVGTFAGVVSAGRSAVAIAVATCFAVMSVLALAWLAAMLLGADPAPELNLRAVHLSPIVLLVGAFGLLPFGLEPANPGLALAGLGLLAAALLGITWWVHVREQGADAWESTPLRQALVAIATVAALALPAALASPSYALGGDPIDGATHRSMSNVQAALVSPGALAADALMRGGRGAILDAGRPNQVELVLMLPTNTSWEVRDIRVVLTPASGLRLDGPAERHFATLPTSENLTMPARGGEFPHGSYSLPVLRVPLVLEPGAVERFTHNVHGLKVHMSWVALPVDAPANVDAAERREEGDLEGPLPRQNVASASLDLRSHVPEASLHMGLAGAPGVAACLGGLALRRARTR